MSDINNFVPDALFITAMLTAVMLFQLKNYYCHKAGYIEEEHKFLLSGKWQKVSVVLTSASVASKAN